MKAFYQKTLVCVEHFFWFLVFWCLDVLYIY
jgi:hypothetical protein